MVKSTTAVQRAKNSTSTNGAQWTTSEKISSTVTHQESNCVQHNEVCTDADNLTLWQHPITTLNYFFRELLLDILSLGKKTLRYKRTVWSTISLVALFLLLSRISGPQQEVSPSFSQYVESISYCQFV